MSWSRNRRRPVRAAKQTSTKNSTKNLKKKIWMGSAVFFAVLIFAAFFWLASILENPNFFPFKEVKVDVIHNLMDINVLKNTVKHNIQGGFFSLNARQLENSLLIYPWIETISIRRIWPDSLLVTISNRVPIAHWGNNYYIDNTGEIFTLPANIQLPSLPYFDAGKGAQLSLVKSYQNFNKSLLPLELHIQKISLDERQLWEILLSNGILVILGRDDIDHRWNLFIHLYNKLLRQPHHQKIEYIDLRYPNGLAVKWV